MATPIKLKEAAKYYGEEPHQVQAWDWLEAVSYTHLTLPTIYSV